MQVTFSWLEPPTQTLFCSQIFTVSNSVLYKRISEDLHKLGDSGNYLINWLDLFITVLWQTMPGFHVNSSQSHHFPLQTAGLKASALRGGKDFREQQGNLGGREGENMNNNTSL